MACISESDQIAGLKFVQLQVFEDERGRFMETFRKEWFPERTWAALQSNRSDSRAGVLRGLHYHFRQVDYWYVPVGRVRVGLADLRRTSPTSGASQVFEIGEQNPLGVFIPPGVAHGFVALTDATLIYVVDQYYNREDELGVVWNDPTLALPWGISNPLLSERDQLLPALDQIDPARLP
ncbi:MAG: dTDP-4-dehydrorhamnose 3,5-epimerase [Chloroflexi bacterium]|nr:MAG: dTDP-4-dehydrorhamnose 3,5-epimerase [Chloroflexota bacterium]